MDSVVHTIKYLPFHCFCQWTEPGKVEDKFLIVEEEFLTEGVKTESYYGNDIKITLKDNEYYVLGDNR